MRRPQVLVFIDWYLPGYKAGGPVRSVANIVDHLRDRVDLHIVAGDTDYTEEAPYPDVVPDRWTTLPGGEKVWYASRSGINDTVWKQLLEQKSWDAVYINGIYSRWFSVAPLRLSKRMGLLRVVAVRGMLASGAMRFGRLKKRLFLFAAGLLGFFRNVRFQATNAEEANDIRRWIASDADVRIVPNLPRRMSDIVHTVAEKHSGGVKLISVARIAVEKNTLLAIEALQHVRGEVRFDLYGPVYDEAYWDKCQQAIDRLPSHVKVLHHGPLPSDQVASVLAAHHALFMPSAGENFGHTMLEALLQGLPLLISDRTPWRGLETLGAGWDLPLDRPAGFTEAVQQLVDMDQGAYDRSSAAAFALGKRTLDDPEPVQRTLELFLP